LSATASFPRTVEALDQIFAFTSETFAREGIDRGILGTVDFVLEELFTNVVKYGHAAQGLVQIELRKVPGGVEAVLTEDDANPFDPTAAPDVDISLPIEARAPGGLGLHLMRRLVDAMEYRYNAERRQSRITFRKTLAAEPAMGEKNAGD